MVILYHLKVFKTSFENLGFFNSILPRFQNFLIFPFWGLLCMKMEQEVISVLEIKVAKLNLFLSLSF